MTTQKIQTELQYYQTIKKTAEDRLLSNLNLKQKISGDDIYL